MDVFICCSTNNIYINLANKSISTNATINKATQVYAEDIIPRVKQENTISMMRKYHVTRIPHCH